MPRTPKLNPPPYIPMRAGILPLDYTRQPLPPPSINIDIKPRTEFSLFIQSHNWGDILGLITDPKSWLREVAIRWKHVPFCVKTPTTLIIQHLYRNPTAIIAAADFLQSYDSSAFDSAAKELGYNVDSPLNKIPIEWIFGVLKKLMKHGYFHLEYALDTDTINVSYMPPLNPPNTIADFPPYKMTKVTAVRTGMYDPTNTLEIGRMHFDIGKNDEEGWANRATLIKSYLETQEPLCKLLTTKKNTGGVIEVETRMVQEGKPLIVSDRIKGTRKTFKGSMPAPVLQKAGYSPSTIIAPTVTVQGLSTTSDCYICVDTALLAGADYYPTDVLYKLYCD